MEDAMRSFLMSIAVIVGMAVGAMFLLESTVQRHADQAFMSTSTSVRIPDHGNTHNLVGQNWYSPKEHGWESRTVPTSNAPAPLTN
jgi:hypothetical protein